MTIYESFQKDYPFISCIRSNDLEYLGIIINFDNNIVSIYDISLIKDKKERATFLELGETWWWESNRKIPINIFLKSEMIAFRYSVRTLAGKDTELIFGPKVNLSDIAEKRVKRKSIQLVRSPRNLRG